MRDFWIFSYGSLMWNPGFSYQNLRIARLFGYHRSLCIYSHHYRGTPEQPGLVMGLSHGGSCQGIAFQISKDKAQEIYSYLITREQVNKIYKEKHVSLYLEDGRKVQGLTFVADPIHPQYAGVLALGEIAKIVSVAIGKTGSNQDYVLNTIRYLRTIKVYDRFLEMVAKQLQ